MKRTVFILFMVLWACFAHASAPLPTDSVRVSFAIFAPGPDIYELEGHAALRIQVGNQDVAISYGTFDFDAPNFVYRYVKGETDYWVTQVPWIYFEDAYRRQGRSIVEHEIVMDSVQKARLLNIINTNLLPQNRTYRYNYVKDNCSLRPLRVLQSAMGSEIKLPAPEGEAAKAHTFREAMRFYHKNYPWYQFGIDLALGSGIDHPISTWDMAFAPASLNSQLKGATVDGRPLAKAPIEINSAPDATLGATPWWLTPMAVAIALLAITLAISIRDMARLRITRWFDTTLYSIFGLAGLLLAFLVFVSTHEATSPNWLLLWLNPFCLIVPIFIWLKKCNIVVFSYQIANFALIIVLAIAWPWTGQSGNAAFAPLIACDLARSFTYIYVKIRTLHQ